MEETNPVLERNARRARTVVGGLVGLVAGAFLGLALSLVIFFTLVTHPDQVGPGLLSIPVVSAVLGLFVGLRSGSAVGDVRRSRRARIAAGAVLGGGVGLVAATMLVGGRLPILVLLATVGGALIGGSVVGSRVDR